MSKQQASVDVLGKKVRRKSYLKIQLEVAIDFLGEHGVFESRKIANQMIKMYAKKRYNTQTKKQ